MDGARAGTDATYGPMRSLEFGAIFGGATFQHAGFGNDFNAAPWAIFSTNSAGNQLFARTNNGSSQIDTLIPGDWVGAPHQYRIEWTESSVVFFIDGIQVVSRTRSRLTRHQQMRPLVSDFDVSGPTSVR